MLKPGNVKNVKSFCITDKNVLKTREMLKMLKSSGGLKAKMGPKLEHF